MNLGFKIVRTPYPSASKMTGDLVLKVRDDGRRGPAVGDEALLWDALQQTQAKLQTVLQALKDETQARLDAQKECDDLRGKLKGMADRIAAQSELLSKQVEKGVRRGK